MAQVRFAAEADASSVWKMKTATKMRSVFLVFVKKAVSQILNAPSFSPVRIVDARTRGAAMTGSASSLPETGPRYATIQRVRCPVLAMLNAVACRPVLRAPVPLSDVSTLEIVSLA